MKKIILPLIAIMLIASCKKDLKQYPSGDNNSNVSKAQNITSGTMSSPGAISSKASTPQVSYNLPTTVINAHRDSFVNAHLNPILTSKNTARGGCDRVDATFGEVIQISGIHAGPGGCNDHIYDVVKYRLYISVAVKTYSYPNDVLSFTVINPITNDILGTNANVINVNEEADITNVLFGGEGHVTYTYEFTASNYHDLTNISFGFLSGTFQSNNGFSNTCSLQSFSYDFPYALSCSGFISQPGFLLIFPQASNHSMNVGTLHCNAFCLPSWYQFSNYGDFYYSTSPTVSNPIHIHLPDCTLNNTGALTQGTTYYYYFTETYPCGTTPASPIQSFVAP